MAPGEDFDDRGQRLAYPARLTLPTTTLALAGAMPTMFLAR
jgi:hypothetical protein